MKWLKELVKRDIIAFLILSFLVGAVAIWGGDKIGLVHLTDDGKLNSTVSWLTALAIFWYAFETYQLKKNTTEQVNIEEEIMLNEFLPILEPLSSNGKAIFKNGQFIKLSIRNLGKGPAKYIRIHIGRERAVLTSSLAAGGNELIKLDAASRRTLKAAVKGTPGKIKFHIAYQDIYNRRFKTDNIIFDRMNSGTYELRSGAWDFKRIAAKQPTK